MSNGRTPAAKRKRTGETDGAKTVTDWDALEYMAGFGNEFQSETIEGALPKGQNNPQRVRRCWPPQLGTALAGTHSRQRCQLGDLVAAQHWRECANQCHMRNTSWVWCVRHCVAHMCSALSACTRSS